MTDEEERELRIAIMQADLQLKTKQGMWETPRNIAILAGSIAAIAAAAGGWLGYTSGRQASVPPTQIIQLPPGTIITVPK